MPSFSNLKKTKLISKTNVSSLIALIAITVSVFTGCGGKSDGENPRPTPTPTYSVQFITNGGSAVDARSVQQGGVITTSPETTREGFVFDGWFTDNNTFANKVSFPYTPTGNITLYAKWTQLAGTYTVTFETNGGSYLATLNNVSSIATEPHTSRAGYDFDGWFPASNFSGGRITFPYTVTQNITLYAKWTQVAGTYTVTFETNGGSSVTTLNNVSSIATEPHTSLAGYDFDGWFAASDFSGGRISFPYTVTQNITLYAKWTAIYTVTFETNGGTSVTTLNNISSIATEPNTSRLSYDFDGWFAASDFSGGRITFPYTVAKNITLYAKWTEAVSWIEIWTPAQMNDVRNNLSAGYRIMADISLSSYSNWVPIGTEAAPFTGKITGNGYKITGLRVNNTSAPYAGLFGNVISAEIARLALENVDITGRDYAGAIAGYMEGGAITDSYSTGKIDTTSSSTVTHSGGIVGRANTTITDCYSTATINSTSSWTVDRKSYSGGIAGRIDGGAITGSYSTGDITSSHTISSSGSSSYSGGIVGCAGDCGLTGYGVNDVEIAGSYSTGAIASTAYLSFAGGIMGLGYIGENSTITDSYSEGNITSSGSIGYAGGIVGDLNGNVGISGNYSTGDITSTRYTGGIAGRLTGGIITNSYSKGDISAEYYSGGIAGHVDNGTIAYSYSTGDITTTQYNESHAGGIAGRVNDSTIINCAAINGTINTQSSYTHYVGRIAGYIEGAVTITNNFALSTMSATGFAFNTSDTMYHGVSKTDAQLKQQSTYSDATSGDGLGGLGWGFGSNETNPWRMPSSDYPIFYWQ